MLGNEKLATAKRPATETDDMLVGRLLYVEDNPHIAEITGLLLEDMGLDITQAFSAEEALRIADEALIPFDMVLTDVVMPGLSGVQLAKRLNRRWPDLPVLLVSGFGDELACGYASHYELLPKPFTRMALFDCLQRHLDGAVYQNA